MREGSCSRAASPLLLNRPPNLHEDVARRWIVSGRRPIRDVHHGGSSVAAGCSSCRTGVPPKVRRDVTEFGLGLPGVAARRRIRRKIDGLGPKVCGPGMRLATLGDSSVTVADPVAAHDLPSPSRRSRRVRPGRRGRGTWHLRPRDHRPVGAGRSSRCSARACRAWASLARGRANFLAVLARWCRVATCGTVLARGRGAWAGPFDRLPLSPATANTRPTVPRARA